MRYQIHGVTLCSDLELPELALAVRQGAAGVEIRVRSALRTQQPRAIHEDLSSWMLPDGKLWLSVGKHAAGYVLRFPELADFQLTADGLEISVYPAEDLPAHTLRHLLLDQVFPLALSLRGVTALHASAVLTPFGVVAFMGPTGQGKSTLAAGLLRDGYPVLSDDCLVLEERNGGLWAAPSYPGLRLREDALAALGSGTADGGPVAHYSSKRRLLDACAALTDETGFLPVRRLYSLMTRPIDPVGAPRIASLSAHEGVAELVPFFFHLDVGAPSRARRHFDFLCRVVSCVSIRRLWAPRVFQSLPATINAVLADAASPAGG